MAKHTSKNRLIPRVIQAVETLSDGEGVPVGKIVDFIQLLPNVRNKTKKAIFSAIRNAEDAGLIREANYDSYKISKRQNRKNKPRNRQVTHKCDLCYNRQRDLTPKNRRRRTRSPRPSRASHRERDYSYRSRSRESSVSSEDGRNISRDEDDRRKSKRDLRRRPTSNRLQMDSNKNDKYQSRRGLREKNVKESYIGNPESNTDLEGNISNEEEKFVMDDNKPDESDQQPENKASENDIERDNN